LVAGVKSAEGLHLVGVLWCAPADGRHIASVGETTERVEGAIRALATVTLSAGDRLPSERTLADELNAGRTTVRLVLVKLAAEGLVRSEHGRGYFVCERPG
jgi:DNA-binding FadR family transcriptional regulator